MFSPMITSVNIRFRTCSQALFWLGWVTASMTADEISLLLAHPRTRVTEADIDQQVLAVFDKMRVEDEGVWDWFRMVLASQTRDSQADYAAKRRILQIVFLNCRLQDKNPAPQRESPSTFSAKDAFLKKVGATRHR
jgi:hypothetical protein